jgi:DNA-binding response OmpR family regulator
MTNQRRPSVLVAIADATDRGFVGGIAVEMGFPTISVGSEAAAWRALRSLDAGIVIVELPPGAGEGTLLCEQIRKFTSDECVVGAVAGRNGDGDLRLGLASGVDDLITRPFSFGQVTNRLLALEQLLATRRSLHETEREATRLRWLAEVGQAALTFQHEINNPLTALYAHLELLQSSNQTSASAAELASAVAQARRIQAVVTELAQPSRSSQRRITESRLQAAR